MSDELLRHPTHNGHLLVGALKRHKNKPVLFLGDTTLTGGQLAERISQYTQAFEALGAGTGVTVGLLALNRPEVLMILGASQTQGYRRTALHPMGSLDDHAYVLSDCGASSLIIDPNPMFVERALGLLEKVDSLKQILTIGPVPRELVDLKVQAVDLSAEAAKYDPKPLVVAELAPDHIGGMAYTGGTTGKPKGVLGTTGNIATMTQIQLSEWEWPEDPRFLMCTPLSHAGAAFFTPTVVKGGVMVVLRQVRPGRGAENHRGAKDNGHHAGAVDALRADGPPGFAHPRPVLTGDRLLRRLGDEPGAAGRGDPAVRPDLRAVLRAIRGADGHHLFGQGRSR